LKPHKRNVADEVQRYTRLEDYKRNVAHANGVILHPGEIELQISPREIHEKVAISQGRQGRRGQARKSDKIAKPNTSA
jgi:hypothetical protein